MTTEPTNRLKVENYGDMLAKLRDMQLVFYECMGSYQGSYLAVLLDEPDKYDDTLTKRFFLYKGNYGSCSGCDWLEAERNWSDDTVDYKEANEFCSQMKPVFILPAKPCSADELLGMFRADSYDFEFEQEQAEKVAEAMAKALAPRPTNPDIAAL